MPKEKPHVSKFSVLFHNDDFDVLLAQFTSVNSFAGRIGMYFSQFEMLAFPAICYETRNKKIIQFCLIGYMLFYWWFFYVLNGVNATVPYVLGV